MGASKIVLMIILLVASTYAYDATRTKGANGQDVVDASVTEVQDTCIFSNDRQFMRRLAYVETKFGTIPYAKSDGIWQLNQSYFNVTLQSKYQSTWQKINNQLNVNYTSFNYANGDMSVPLYNAIATRFYFSITSDPVPWTIADQANYYVKYYNPDATNASFVNGLQGLPEPCNSPGADILFMLDGSGSITLPNFNLMKQFLINIIGNFTIDLDDYQMAVLVFSDSVTDYIAFNSYNWDVTVLEQKINNLKYVGGGTRTDLALQYALMNVFTQAGGVRPENEGYPRVGIVITDGQSNNPQYTATAAAQDKAAGLVLFSVGVGNSISTKELNTIASDPTCMHVYTLQDFAGLSQGFPEELKAQTCVAPAIIQPNNSIINNRVGQDQYMYFQFTANTTAGITFQLQMQQGTAALYLATDYSHPTEVQYDYEIQPTSGTSSVYISPNQLNTSAPRLSYSSNVFTVLDTETVYGSIKGIDASNNFTITVFDGDYLPSTTTMSSTTTLFNNSPAFHVAILFLNLFLVRLWY